MIESLTTNHKMNEPLQYALLTVVVVFAMIIVTVAVLEKHVDIVIPPNYVAIYRRKGKFRSFGQGKYRIAKSWQRHSYNPLPGTRITWQHTSTHTYFIGKLTTTHSIG